MINVELIYGLVLNIVGVMGCNHSTRDSGSSKTEMSYTTHEDIIATEIGSPSRPIVIGPQPTTLEESVNQVGYECLRSRTQRRCRSTKKFSPGYIKTWRPYTSRLMMKKLVKLVGNFIPGSE